MKSKFSLRLLAGFVPGLVLFFTSCSKEELPVPQSTKGNPENQGQVVTSNASITPADKAVIVTPSPKFPSPDIGYNLVEDGLYSIHPIGRNPDQRARNVILYASNSIP